MNLRKTEPFSIQQLIQRLLLIILPEKESYQIGRGSDHEDRRKDQRCLRFGHRKPRKLIGVRDPLGLKPLCLGKRDDSYIIASESCALTAIGAQFLRDIKPGEIVTITREGITSNLTLCQSRQAHCIFEYIYFARLDSKLDGISVYESRLRAGAALAKAYPADADLVVGVPDSGILPHRDRG